VIEVLFIKTIRTMKQQHFFLFILSISTILFGCSGTGIKISEPNSEEISQIKPLGDRISKELVTTLQFELKKAVKEGGLNKAINVCNMKAIPLTSIIADATDKVVHIKRTTYRYRNPDNAPDVAEKAALDHYKSLINEQKDIPPFYIQKIEQKGGTYYNYYKPMKIATICLNCHGANDKINQETLKEINKLYPDDRAMDYKEGDFRGLIRISIE